jgi:hypothetical protein
MAGLLAEPQNAVIDFGSAPLQPGKIDNPVTATMINMTLIFIEIYLPVARQRYSGFRTIYYR